MDGLDVNLSEEHLSDELWPSTVDEPADVNCRAWSVLDGASMFIICHLVSGTEPAL